MSIHSAKIKPYLFTQQSKLFIVNSMDNKLQGRLLSAQKRS